MAGYKTRRVGARTGVTTFSHEERPVANGVTVTDGDFVKLVQGGTVTNASIGTGKLYGVVTGGPNDDLVSRNYREPVTVGDATGTKKVVVELPEGARYEIATSTDLPSNSVGSYFNLQGTTGAQVVDVSSLSANVGQLLCLERIPTNDEETEFKRGIFMVAAQQTATTPS